MEMVAHSKYGSVCNKNVQWQRKKFKFLTEIATKTLSRTPLLKRQKVTNFFINGVEVQISYQCYPSQKN